MATSRSNKAYSDLGTGTYELPGVGLVRNGELLDGNDVDAVAAFHAQDDKSRDASAEALQARDAALVEVVTAPAPDADASQE